MGVKNTLRGLREQWRMFRELWKTTSSDRRGALIEELLFSPDRLRRRYHNEQVFRSQMDGRWQ